ncbi:hypothetical protein CJ219_08125 [Haemophilus parainfluenzae]|jgi:hypothetical protein|uniref:Uncharacterized protein n=1 Tax=Haemophilus parainfluenzae TaxID=729 RepID=A0AAE7YYA3_HAEPA|nr:hypothetical protein CJ219_08125 [Haemophilus parainfluenzae]RDE74188.1 hypothetical protein DPV94_09850 [Haemophilus parainfluenzae]RDE74247.1 hypothetical protein DPV85_06030 [Haemophilus parainfluenzae]RDE82218.1 hypothetical protein DPV95_09510 [Haemophilus parainfluenzae]
MTEEKKYPQLSMNEFFFTYSFIFVLLLFISVIIFFNDVPITNFEIFIDKYLVKGRGVYSHIYSFQSEIISNLSMIIAPLFAIYLALTLKLTYSSENEIINSGRVIEKSVKKTILMKFCFIISALLLVTMCMFLTYIYNWDLEESKTNTLFVRDNVIWLLSLTYIIYTGTFFTLFVLFSVIRHPVSSLKYHIYRPN